MDAGRAMVVALFVGLPCCAGPDPADGASPRDPRAALQFHAVEGGAAVPAGEVRFMDVDASIGKSDTTIEGDPVDGCGPKFAFRFPNGLSDGTTLPVSGFPNANGTIVRDGGPGTRCPEGVQQVWSASAGSLTVEQNGTAGVVRVVVSDVRFDALQVAENAARGSFSVSGFAEGVAR